MLKSLFSGISGLQSHQVALDVESNNIANVNTTGFKYSRANFSNLLAQTGQIATSPQGELGGKNAVQVGLGASINSVTRIHSQGSIQNTDKNTDLALEGDGYFIVSADGGITDQYTRSGDFKFDANGNFVDNNGYIIQGWLRDDTTGSVDSNAPTSNIVIPPGLTTPAQATEEVVVKANLNSGPNVSNFSSIYSLDAFSNAADRNRDGKLDKADSLSGANANLYDNSPWFNGAGATSGAGTNADRIFENSADGIYGKNFIDADGNTIERGEDFGALVDATGRAFQLAPAKVADEGQGMWTSFRPAEITTDPVQVAAPDPTVPSTIAANTYSFELSNGSSENIGEIILPGAITDDGTSTGTVIDNTANALAIIDAINKATDKTGVTASLSGTTASPTIIFSNDNEGDFKNIRFNDALGPDNLFPANANPLLKNTIIDDPAKMFRYTDVETLKGWENSPTIVGTASAAFTPGGFPRPASDYIINGVPLTGDTLATAGTIASIVELAEAINEAFTIDNNPTPVLPPAANSTEGPIYAEIDGGGDLIITASTAKATFSGALAGTGVGTAGGDTLDITVSNSPDTYYFETTEDLRQGMQELLRNDKTLDVNAEGRAGTGISTSLNTYATVEVSADGKFTIKNPAGDDGVSRDVNVAITGINQENGATENIFFTETMESLNGALVSGSNSTRTSGTINTPIHSSSLDIYDSLGSAHTFKIDFRKIESPNDDGTVWAVSVTVPPPGVIDNQVDGIGTITNIVEGTVSFNDDGSLKEIKDIDSIEYTANNGSAPQTIDLNFGQKNQLDGLTSFDAPSATSNVRQDGFTGGDLLGIRVDQSGTLVGTFTNGRSFGLAQVATAKFANDEGLSSVGGNVFALSGNSGDPIVGTAATGGRGTIRSSSLEASNVDLSRSLTQLIIIQRGYQANGKTITTSDQILNTLINLKN